MNTYIKNTLKGLLWYIKAPFYDSFCFLTYTSFSIPRVTEKILFIFLNMFSFNSKIPAVLFLRSLNFISLSLKIIKKN